MNHSGDDLVQEQSAKRGTGANILIFLMLFLTIMGVAYFMYLKSNGVDIKNVSLGEAVKIGFLPKDQKQIENHVWELKLDIKEQLFFEVYKDYLVRCAKDDIRFYSREDGKEVWTKNLPINSPILKANASDLLVADMGGKELYVLRDKDVKWYRKMEGNIINADLNSGGYIAVSHEAKGYKGAVTVLNLQGNPFFTRNIAGDLLINTKVSPSGKSVAINSMVTSGVQAYTNVELTDHFGKPLAQKLSLEKTLLTNTWFLNNEAVVLVGDTMAVYLDKSGNKKWEKDFGTGRIYSSNVALEKYIILAVQDDKSGFLAANASEVKILGTNGEETGTYKLDSPVRNLEVCSDVIAVNTGREVHFISTKGKLIGKYASKADVDSVEFFNKQQAVIITKASAVMVQIP